jgi:mannose-6-phosphate isomerase
VSAQASAGGGPDPATFVVRRPWGSFEQLATNVTATVKIITVEAGQRLSLQRHEFRDELWHVLDDGITVNIASEEERVVKGGSVFVPRATTHRIANTGPKPARVLEVAFGQFDEQDIERLSDDYGRSEAPKVS